MSMVSSVTLNLMALETVSCVIVYDDPLAHILEIDSRVQDANPIYRHRHATHR